MSVIRQSVGSPAIRAVRVTATTGWTALQIGVTRRFGSHSLRIGVCAVTVRGRSLVSCMIRSIVVRVASTGNRVVFLCGVAMVSSSIEAAVVAIAHDSTTVARLRHRRQHISVTLRDAAHRPAAEPALLGGTSHVTMRRVCVAPSPIIGGRVEAERTDGPGQCLSTLADDGEDDSDEHDGSQRDGDGDDGSLAQTGV